MGRDKSRAHLSHRIDHNAEQQLEAMRQKLVEVSLTVCVQYVQLGVVFFINSKGNLQLSFLLLSIIIIVTGNEP